MRKHIGCDVCGVVMKVNRDNAERADDDRKGVHNGGA